MNTYTNGDGQVWQIKEMHTILMNSRRCTYIMHFWKMHSFYIWLPRRGEQHKLHQCACTWNVFYNCRIHKRRIHHTRVCLFYPFLPAYHQEHVGKWQCIGWDQTLDHHLTLISLLSSWCAHQRRTLDWKKNQFNTYVECITMSKLPSTYCNMTNIKTQTNKQTNLTEGNPLHRPSQCTDHSCSRQLFPKNIWYSYGESGHQQALTLPAPAGRWSCWSVRSWTMPATPAKPSRASSF